MTGRITPLTIKSVMQMTATLHDPQRLVQRSVVLTVQYHVVVLKNLLEVLSLVVDHHMWLLLIVRQDRAVLHIGQSRRHVVGMNGGGEGSQRV